MGNHEPIDSTIEVVTPENISFQYQVAGPFRRLPAFLVDLIVRVGIWAALLLTFVIAGFQMGSGAGSMGLAVWLLAWFVLEWFYGGLLETYWNGQTVGKRLLGMRVLRTDGQPINGFQAITRNILRLVDLMPLVPLGVWNEMEGPWVVPTCLIGLGTSLLNRRYQRLGDLVCGTMVVVEQRRRLANMTKISRDGRVRQLAASLPAGFVVSRKLSNALCAYMERRRYLAGGRRDEIASHLVRPLATRLGLPANTNPDRLLCAMYCRTFIESPTGSDSMRGLSGTELDANLATPTAEARR